MADKSEWLPAGWTSTIRTSKNGRKYKCYTDPSNKLKFLSKPEVIRYLNSLESNLPLKSEDDNVESNLLLKSEDNNEDSGHPKPLEKSKQMIMHSDKNVVVEDAVAEGLPPGWIKEVRVTQRGKSIRRDSYYTDPTSGYVFPSLKDCKRYLKTGVLGKSSFMPKDKDHVDVELEPENDNISSPAVDQGNEVQDGETDKTVAENNGEILTPAITEDHMSLQYPSSDQSRSDITGSDLNSQSTKSVEQIEGKSDSLVSSPVVENYPENLGNVREIHETDKSQQKINKSNYKRSSDFPRRASKRLAGVELDPVPVKLLENGVVHETDKIQNRINKSNDKRSSDFPRRASKRLAGVELDPVSKLKTNDRTRRPSAQQSGKTTSFSGNTHDLPAKEELPENFELHTMTSEQQRLSTALPLANLANSKEPIVQEKHLQISEEQAREKEPSPISIEQATEEKSLPASGEQYGDEDSMMLSEEDQGGKKKLLFLSKEQAAEKERANEIDAILESSTNLSMEDLWKDPCIEFAIKTLTGAIPIGEEIQADKNSGSSTLTGAIPIGEEIQAEKNSVSSTLTGAIPIGVENQADKNYGSSAEISFSDIWTDPCIEFAVKTLTGDIPLDEDPSVQNLFQQQVSSSDIQGVSGKMLPNSQTDYISQYCNAVEKPQNSKQQVTAASRIPQSNTKSLQTSDGSDLHQSIQGRT